MILVIVGTNYFPFDRLIMYVDKKIAPHHKVFLQLGVSTYTPLNCAHKKFYEESEVDLLLQKCSLVICHGGFGIITKALKANKIVIAVPRNPSLNECLDDQYELCNYLAAAGLIKTVEDVNMLETTIKTIEDFHPSFQSLKHESQIEDARGIVEKFIQEECK